MRAGSALDRRRPRPTARGDPASTDARPRRAGRRLRPPRPAWADDPALGASRQLVVLTFLYTSCPDICPLIADNVDTAVRSLGAERRDVVFPGGVGRPRSRHSRRGRTVHHGASPSRELPLPDRPLDELKPIWQAYNLLIEPGSSGRVAHSAYILLIDRAGGPRMYYPPRSPRRPRPRPGARWLLPPASRTCSGRGRIRGGQGRPMWDAVLQSWPGHDPPGVGGVRRAARLPDHAAARRLDRPSGERPRSRQRHRPHGRVSG